MTSDLASPPLRPRFDPSTPSESCPPLTGSDGSTWIPLISCPTDCPPELFEIAVSQLIHHPEYNSTLILRSDTLSESTADFPAAVPELLDLRPTKLVHRRLLPRRPGRDASLEQFCTLYAHGTDPPSALLLTPLVPPGSPFPYYHPSVSHLAFRYIAPGSAPDAPRLQIEVRPLPDIPTDPGSRLYRTCLMLLDTLHRYCWGAVAHYTKRVRHDCLVPREAYQDLYLVMRERHRHLVGQWREVTDPLKHVFEDIGIATFLMLLWKDTFAAGDLPAGTPDAAMPWHTWPRPPGGFLDLGCGNGLLTHILTAEGYAGHGLDVRARTSWAHYPAATRARLHVHALDPTAPPAPPCAAPFLARGAFLVGNHADELTPWLPVLATLRAASGYLSIPCCAWAFDARYERARAPALPLDAAPGFADALNLGGAGGGGSAYSMYRVWLARLSVCCGWEVECEMLRIPSTRNWAIVGRRRLADPDGEDGKGHRRNAEMILDGVRQRGIFGTRKPEGKGLDH